VKKRDENPPSLLNIKKGGGGRTGTPIKEKPRHRKGTKKKKKNQTIILTSGKPAKGKTDVICGRGKIGNRLYVGGKKKATTKVSIQLVRMVARSGVKQLDRKTKEKN